MILVLLQNAWAHNARGAAAMQADRELWIWATANCRSGQRLRIMLGEDCFDEADCFFANTTPVVGVGSSAKLPPDDAHVAGLFDQHKPRLVVACGLQAEGVARRLWWGENLLCVPHPASRLLTNVLYERARRHIKAETPGWWAMRQRRDRIDLEQLERDLGKSSQKEGAAA